ncbi:hypothetical protein E5K00_01130 [Hymenobacter aquaticus]|uniref:Uncharacterized protein n=1 Tax=Hymenobacter aquaticus TaxID=1867101 RepID=A0A4Z0Q2Y6_9BACT|nr:hypothetical protein [Hymenobacter aquaticus]TGE23849.1 hypothetical protein E5K00_01130 [Hymenobacter aquaticus]
MTFFLSISPFNQLSPLLSGYFLPHFPPGISQRLFPVARRNQVTHREEFLVLFFLSSAAG